MMQKKLKLFKKKIILLFFLFFSVNSFSLDLETYDYLSSLKTCNLENERGPSKRIERDINSIAKAINEPEIQIIIETYVDFKDRLTCFEKVNLSSMYASVLFKTGHYAQSLELLQYVDKYRGLNREFKKSIDKRVANAQSKIKQLDRGRPDSVSTYQPIEEDKSEYIDRIKVLENEIALLEYEKIILQGYEAKNKDLQKSIEVLEENIKRLSRGGSEPDQSFYNEEINSLKEELESTKFDLEQQIFLYEESEKLISELTLELGEVKSNYELMEKELDTSNRLIDKYLSGSSKGSSGNESNNSFFSDYWWILVLIAIFYFFYQNSEEKISLKGVPETPFGFKAHLEDLKESIMEQIDPLTQLDKSLDSFVFHYLKGISSSYIEDSLESKIAFDELIEELFSENSSIIKQKYFLEESDLALEGMKKGKEDGYRLKEYAQPVVLKNYLNKKPNTD